MASVLGVAAGFVAARWLDPDRFGVAQTIILVYFLASLVRTGIYEGSIRTAINQMGRGDDDGARRTIDVGVTVETVVSLVPGLLLLVAVPFTSDGLVRLGLFLAPAAVALSSISSYLGGVHLAAKRFGLAARVALLRAVVYPVALLVLVGSLGAAGIFVAPLVADGLVVTAYLTMRPRTGVRATLDWSGSVGLIRIGFPLGLAAMVYWAYRTVGSVSVAWGADAATYGFYAFALAPVAIVARLITSVHTVLMPSLWEEIARNETERSWVRDSARVTVALALAAGFATNVCQAGFPVLVEGVVSRYAEADRFFEILVFNVFLLSVAAVPSLVLDSEAVNKQVRHLVIWIVALAVNVVANIAALTWTSTGPIVVAWNDVWIQGLVVIAVFASARPHLGRDWADHRVEHTLVALAVLTGLCGLALHASSVSAGDSHARLLVVGAVRVAAVLAVWTMVAALVRGRVVSQRPAA